MPNRQLANLLVILHSLLDAGETMSCSFGIEEMIVRARRQEIVRDASWASHFPRSVSHLRLDSSRSFCRASRSQMRTPNSIDERAA